MSALVRFGVSLEAKLLSAFDRFIARKKYSNRSEAIRDLIRNELVEQEWGDNKETVGTITLVYDHHRADLQEQLTEFQHQFTQLIIANTHVHLDHDHCLEVIIIRGKSSSIRNLAHLLIGTKGVIHGRLTTTTTGKMMT